MIHATIFGVKLEIHFSFFLLLGFIILSGNSLFAACSAMFSLLHEFAHERVAKLSGYTPEKISFGLFGGVLHVREGFIKPSDELLIHLSGPFFNLTVAAILYGVYNYNAVLWLEPVILANLVLAIFNLMPFYPLDGGKIVGLYLAFFLGYGRSQRISRIAYQVFSLLLFFLGIYLVQYNMLNLLVSVLAVNLFIAGKQDNSFIFYKVSRNIEEGAKANKSKIVVCRSDVKAVKVLEKYKPHDNRSFTIVNEKGHYKGQLSEEDVLDGIYKCGIYVDFGDLLAFKKQRQKQQNRKG